MLRLYFVFSLRFGVGRVAFMSKLIAILEHIPMYLIIFDRSSHNQIRTCQARPHAAANSRGVSLLAPG